MDWFYTLAVYDPKNPLIFTDSLFWLLMLGVMLVYTYQYQQIATRNLFLLGFSLFFYYKAGGYFFVLLLLSTVIDYYAGKFIAQSSHKPTRLFWLNFSLVANLSLLGYFKYAYFFTDTFNAVAGTQFKTINWFAQALNGLTGSSLDIYTIVLPVGISFYTFQTISYSVDVYRGDVEPARNIWDFAFFVSFFPQLIAGPIVRAADFIPQIYQPYRLSEADYSRAIVLILGGLFKKIVISDYLAVNLIDRVFENPERFTGFENLLAVYGYALQIYGDFSGYSDIAIGLALLLGFRLPDNFNAPYQASSITDFWRRWHISLSTWLRDYLYVPLGGNRHGLARTYLHLMVTMLLGGLWHGAAWRFVLWGGLHGAALALHRFAQGSRRKAAPSGWGVLLVNRLATFHFVCFCWIFFRAKDLDQVGKILHQILFNFRFDLLPQAWQVHQEVIWIMLLGYGLHSLPNTWSKETERFFQIFPDWLKAVVIVLVILGLYQARNAALQPFIYFQF